jgi:hypothetical protein
MKIVGWVLVGFGCFGFIGLNQALQADPNALVLPQAAIAAAFIVGGIVLIRRKRA